MHRNVILLIFLSFLCICGCQSENLSAEKPLIGITSVYRLGADDSNNITWVNYNYIRSIAENGGTPVVLPAVLDEEIIADYVMLLDGLVLVGGNDIPPSVYGQEKHAKTSVMASKRYEFESRLIGEWLETDKPMLGICLGMQMSNVVEGGTMMQDIPSMAGDAVNHRAKAKLHKVNVKKGSVLYDALKSGEAYVYSNHHQAVERIGTNLRVIARADDNVCEALERTDGVFGLFVQWHPEQMKDKKHRDAIYGSLIKAAIKNKSDK